MTFCNPRIFWGQRGGSLPRLQNYEHRMQQLEMADAVAAALADKRHLVVEAGTGVGKSFAYLVPSILAATDPEHATVETDDGQTRNRRIIISTHTISLQEQLLGKDLPLLNSVILESSLRCWSKVEPTTSVKGV